VKRFDECFGRAPEALGSAPGRVNLLGEHTDYNDGLVLPTSIPQHTRIAMAHTREPFSTLYSANLDRRARWSEDVPPREPFARYVYGCIAEAGVAHVALDIHVASDVPIGVGLSSSAALEVATLRALRALLDLPLDDVAIARLGQRAEIVHAGVRCGIMDQMACSLLAPGQMLYLDTRTLERELMPLPAGTEVLVIDSGLSRSLAASKYNERRSQCEQAARMLGVAALRDIDTTQALDALPETLRKRAHHVVAENARVAQAKTADAAEFGRLMSASHRSLSADYEVSVPALDVLVSLMQDEDTVHGAKLTGAGFGGACVALCRQGSAAETGRRVMARYRRLGYTGSVLVPPAAPASG
jgi:galactokinase